jgi:uncharacterized membrane protein
MTISLNNSSIACTVTNGNFTGQCTYVYGTDYIIMLLTVIAVGIIFLVLYFIYKEVTK